MKTARNIHNSESKELLRADRLQKRESRELARLTKMEKRGSGSKYFLILLILIAVVNILDEVTSNLTVTVQSSFITEFFVNNPFMGKIYTI